jgi:hypothetical protein
MAFGDGSLDDGRTRDRADAGVRTMLTVVTTCHEQGLHEYGLRFIKTFLEFWPPDVRLLIYAQGWTASIPRLEVHDLLTASPWLRDFTERHRDNPSAHGRGRGSYQHRWDAVKFAHKVAAVVAADAIEPGDHLLWLDADVLTHSIVADRDIASWRPDPAWLTWLDRDPGVINYPECGFLLFNREHPRHGEALAAVRSLYENDELFRLSETHDSFAWQSVVDALALPTRSLSGDGRRSLHVMVNGPLGAWFDHCKGPRRKTMGRTDKKELIVPRAEKYWQ